MLPGSRAVEDDPCPVTEATLGQMYRASPQGLPDLIATLSPQVRGMLAVYCYRRAHLNSIGLSIAATCEEDDLTRHGGNAGAALFAKSREMAKPALPDLHTGGRRKISLATGTLRTMAPLDDEMDDDELDIDGLDVSSLNDSGSDSTDVDDTVVANAVVIEESAVEPETTLTA